jgi:hypothetical protein
MALGIFKKAWNTTQLADLTDYLTSNLLSKANSNNTASGVDSVTINGLSGVIQYSQAIPANDYSTFTFTNSSVTSNSVILFSIKSPSKGTGGQGLPYIQSYSIVGTTVTVIIANSDGAATNAPFFLNFLIVN